jgi:HEAT repeat protein
MMRLIAFRLLALGTAFAAPAPVGNVSRIITSHDYNPAFREISEECSTKNFSDENFDELKSLFIESTGPTSNLKNFSRLFVACISKADSHRDDSRRFFQNLTADSSTLVGWGYEGLARLGEEGDARFIIADANARSGRRNEAIVALRHMNSPLIPGFLYESLDFESDTLKRRDLLSLLAATGSSMTVAAAETELNSTDWANRNMAAGLLAKLKASDSAPLLASKLDDSKDLVRGAVVDALGVLGDRSAVAPIRKLRNDRSPIVRERVIRALEVLRAANDEDYQSALTDPDSIVRETAALIYSGKGQGVSFVKISNDTSPEVRAESAIQLGRNWNKSGERRLKELISDLNPEVQICAAIALWCNGQIDGEGLLRRALESEKDSKVLTGISSAFARTGKEKSLKSLDLIFHSGWAPSARSTAAIIYMAVADDPSLGTIRAWKAAELDPTVKKTLDDIVRGEIR